MNNTNYLELCAVIRYGPNDPHTFWPLRVACVRIYNYRDFNTDFELLDLITVLELARVNEIFYVSGFIFRNSIGEIMIEAIHYPSIMKKYKATIRQAEIDCGVNLFGKCSCSKVCPHQLTYRPSGACHVSVQRELLLREIFHRDIAFIIREKMI